ncbi:MAG TPA: hypothetical protein VGD31_17400, partial [Sphingobacteriaceae bacterium]
MKQVPIIELRETKDEFVNGSEITEPQKVLPSRRKDSALRSFYVWMSIVCLAVAVIGFAPTYWLQLPGATFSGSPLLHLHGILFTAWTVYLLMQTTLTARGRVARHRAFGLFGISLATAMVFVGFAVANTTLAVRLEAGYGDRARSFQIASISMIALFAIFVFLAIWYVSRPEIHKRLMLLATIATLPPAISRLFFAVNVGIGPGLRPGIGPPRSIDGVLLPTLLADALILAGIAYDIRTRGKPHPVYIIGGAFMVFVHVVRGP